MIHLKATNYAKNVFVRPDDRDSEDVAKGKFGTPIGWYATRHNMAQGWTIYPLSNDDKKWFAKDNDSIKGVYRQLNDRGNTTLIKLDLEKGTVDYFNSKKYENTDRIFWEKHPMKFNRLFIDQGKESFFK